MIPSQLLNMVCQVRDVSPLCVLGRCRSNNAAEARFTIAGIMHDHFFRTLDIAAFLGRERSTICYAIKRHRELLEVCADYRAKVGRVDV